MRRRTLLLVAALTAVPLALPASAASTQLPTPNCYAVADLVGDTRDADLDLAGVALRTLPSSLQAYVRVSSLQSAPTAAPGHRFALTFALGGHTVSLAGSSFVAGSFARDAAGFADGASTQLQVDGVNRRSALSVSFDTAHSFVIFDLPTSELAYYTSVPNPSLLSNLEATSAYDAYVGTLPGDTTRPAGARSSNANYSLGDNRCFGPAPSVLNLLTATTAQYGDRVPVSARLVDSSGRPLASRQVTVSLAGAGTTATTGSDGVLRTSLDPRVVAGTYQLGLSWGGDTVAGPSALTSAFTVGLEQTALSARSNQKRSDRYVAATLKDDDGQPVVGANVVFTVQGRTTTVVTSSRGVAELHDLTPGTSVQAAFNGVSGQYAGSSATTTVTNGNGNGNGHGNDD